MELNNSHLIRQAKKTHVQELEVIYWMIEDAIYEGKNNFAKSMLIDLLHVAKYRPELIRPGLKRPFRERLKEISYSLIDNKCIHKQESITMKPGLDAQKIPFQLESELKKYLTDHKNVLESAFNDQIRIVGTEIETEDGYKCDIVAESVDYFYPIELKIAQGDHAVVSQCSKYCYYFYRKLRYGKFKKLQGVVIAPGYDVWSINELRRVGHWIYFIKMNGDSDVKLERVENN